MTPLKVKQAISYQIGTPVKTEAGSYTGTGEFMNYTKTINYSRIPKMIIIVADTYSSMGTTRYNYNVITLMYGQSSMPALTTNSGSYSIGIAWYSNRVELISKVNSSSLGEIAWALANTKDVLYRYVIIS